MSKKSPDRSTLGGTIQYLREHRGMSQEDLSNKLRLRSDIIPSIEDGECTPSENIIEGIAIALGVPLAYLEMKTIDKSKMENSKLLTFNKVSPVLDNFMDYLIKLEAQMDATSNPNYGWEKIDTVDVKPKCPDCSDLGWIDKNGGRETCPCHLK